MPLYRWVLMRWMTPCVPSRPLRGSRGAVSRFIPSVFSNIPLKAVRSGILVNHLFLSYVSEWSCSVDDSDGLFCCGGGHIPEPSPGYPKVIRGKVGLSRSGSLLSRGSLRWSLQRWDRMPRMRARKDETDRRRTSPLFTPQRPERSDSDPSPR